MFALLKLNRLMTMLNNSTQKNEDTFHTYALDIYVSYAIHNYLHMIVCHPAFRLNMKSGKQGPSQTFSQIHCNYTSDIAVSTYI